MIDLKVVPGDEPQPVEVLEKAIVDLAAGFRALGRSRLQRFALVALLYDQTKISKRDISRILDNLENLERIFLKPKNKPK